MTSTLVVVKKMILVCYLQLKYILKLYFPVIAWAALIAALSLTPSINLPESFWDIISLDKWAHAFVYGTLSYLALRAVHDNEQIIHQKKTQWVILGSIFYGILLEIMQYAFFPNRYFEVLDILANIIGALIGAYIWKFFFTIQ